MQPILDMDQRHILNVHMYVPNQKELPAECQKNNEKYTSITSDRTQWRQGTRIWIHFASLDATDVIRRESQAEAGDMVISRE